jgi:predicted Zn-dependent protease
MRFGQRACLFGPIFVSPNRIAAAQNEAEFAGILAHAMGRAADRDHTRLSTRKQLMQANSMAATTNSPAIWAPGQDSLIPVVLHGFQRAGEHEADRFAVRAG